MPTIKQLKGRLSKLRQRRYMLEKKCEQISKMLPASLIMRERTKDGVFRKATSGGKGIYGYLTYLEGGTTRHKYVKKQDMATIKCLTDNYRNFCGMMSQIRSLNREIVKLLDKIGKMNSEEVTSYVKKGSKRTGKKTGRK